MPKSSAIFILWFGTNEVGCICLLIGEVAYGPAETFQNCSLHLEVGCELEQQL